MLVLVLVLGPTVGVAAMANGLLSSERCILRRRRRIPVFALGQNGMRVLLGNGI